MELRKRRYESEEDYWRIRAFLRAVFLHNGRRERSWQAYRFDYWRWHGTMNLGDGSLEDVFIWEDAGGRIAAVLNQESNGQAFHPDDVSYAVQNRADAGWYRNIQNAPLYRRDLDIVAVAPDGAVASFCTVWFDDVTRTGAFEPVGTVPAHRRRGLGKAVMAEGLRRLKRLGATMACVGSYSVEAHGLYKAMGFTEYELNEPC